MFLMAPLILVKDKKINRMAISGIRNLPLMKGNENLPGPFAILGKTRTPAQTITKANKVPMLVRSVTILLGINRDGIATKKPVIMVAKPGVWYLG